MTKFLSGNWAIAQGAIEAGIGLATSYPGAPSVPILEYILKNAPKEKIKAEWSTNEKVAFEQALGASIVGARALVSMKNAGINWILDPLIPAAYSGIRGGLVIVVVDDPGAHVSVSEQDSRGIAEWLGIPCFEPQTHQQAHDITKATFEISEKLELPVLLKTTTYLAHSWGRVRLGRVLPQKTKITFNKHWKRPYRWNNYAPPRPVEAHKWSVETSEKQKILSENSKFNLYQRTNKPKALLVSSGLASSFTGDATRKVPQFRFDHLRLGFIHPLPEKLIISALKRNKYALIIEDGDPFIEKQVRIIAQKEGLKIKILGKMEGKIFTSYGELVPEKVLNGIKKFLGLKTAPSPKNKFAKLLIPRTPTFCPGCQYVVAYQILEKALKGEKYRILNGDVGCHEMAGFGLEKTEGLANQSIENKTYKPRWISELIDTDYSMGVSIAIAEGQLKAGYRAGKVIALIGDSTFFHAGIPALLNAVRSQTNLLVVIFDNGWTAMTGHHPHPGSYVNSYKKPAKPVVIEDVVKALGVKFIKVFDCFDVKNGPKIIKEALRFKGTSVVIARRECTLQSIRKRK